MAMTPRERLDRWQRIMRVAFERIDALRLSDDLDESFYEPLRAALVAAGATDREIDGVAELLITWVVQTTAPDSETRVSQFALIIDHLACTTVRIGLTPGDTLLTVDFPDRPRRH
jgi:hypothetical protein